MKAMLISENIESCRHVIELAENHNIDFIIYRFPMKALDNIEEVAPNSIIINGVDFPRHWKVIVQYINSYTSTLSDYKAPSVILLVNGLFKSDDFEKALHLNIKTFINIEDERPSEYRELDSIFACCTQGEKISMQSINFLFTNPKSNRIVTGTVNEIESNSISFLPEHAETIFNLQLGEVLTNTVLQIGDVRFTPQCKVTDKQGEFFKFSFDGITKVEKKLINNRLDHLKTNQSATRTTNPVTTT